MDFEKAIDEVAANYSARGYNVVARPKPADLPSFAEDFNVQIVGRMRDMGVLVAIKRNRDEFAADPEMDRYAEITSGKAGWRFDFVLLEGSGRNKEVEGAQEFTESQLRDRFAAIEHIMHEGQIPLAYVAAWATFEASMRRALRSTGQPAGWGTQPRQMMNELVSNGVVSMEEFDRLQEASRLRNVIVHGFSERHVDISDVTFLLDLANRLLDFSSQQNPTS